jgi:uncharacterized protein
MGHVGHAAAGHTDAHERVHSLDVLRGLALLGMIVVHFHMRTLEPPGWEDLIRAFVWRFVETKAHGTFALLFGAGFAIQLRRLETRGAPVVSTYLRRLAALALFGFGAHAFFGYNVLLGYATWGVALLFIRNWSTRALIVTALLSAASVGLYHMATAGLDVVTIGRDAALAKDAANRALAVQVNSALEAAEHQPEYTALLAARLRHMAWFYTRPFFIMPGVTLALFIVGMLAIRHRVFENPTAHRRAIVSMMAFGLVSWVSANWLMPFWTASIGTPRLSAQLNGLLGLVRDQWLTFTYVGGAILAFALWPRILARLRVFGVAGRMALTNYLIQIAVLDLLFSEYALGLGLIRPLLVPVASLVLFGSLVAFSAFWFRRFRYGPAEWLWRCATYWEWQPVRRPLAVTEPGTPRRA